MQMRKNQHGCVGCPMNRRGFLKAGGAACAGALASAASSRRAYAADGPTIHVIYALHAEKQPGPDWPNVGFDFKPHMERINNALTQGCPGFTFKSSTANGPEQTEALINADQDAGVDGYIVYQMNCWNRVVQGAAATGKPVLYADFQFGGSGGFLIYNASFMRQPGTNVGFVASSNLDDLIAAARCFQLVKDGGSVADFVTATAKVRQERTKAASDKACRPDSLSPLSAEDCIEKMNASRILAVRDQKAEKAAPIMGIPLEFIPFSEVNAAWEAADMDEAKAIADRWQETATDVIDVSRECLETSAAMYLGQKAVLENHGANAITINCLGGFYGGHIHAYPCLGFHELNNAGLVGACECDLRSTATMVAFSALAQGRPGYISDPVMDTAKHQIIYAHCVASNRVFGPEGATNPFAIMNHSEDRQGAAVRSILPVGYMTTSLQIEPSRKEILFHQGKAVANDPDDRACRTKLCAEPVGDFEKLFTEWDRWGWHRVTFYGDLKDPVYALAEALGWKVVEEA